MKSMQASKFHHKPIFKKGMLALIKNKTYNFNLVTALRTKMFPTRRGAKVA
jgi:hypothetical protein